MIEDTCTLILYRRGPGRGCRNPAGPGQSGTAWFPKCL